MRLSYKTIVLLLVAALVVLAAAYAVWDGARPAAERMQESVALPTQSASPAAAPAVLLTPTPTPSVPTPSASPTVPEFGLTADSEVARRQPRDVSRFQFFSGNSDGAAYSDGGVSGVEDVLEEGLHLAGASPVHQAFRGTASIGSVRCEWRGIARTLEQREAAIRFWLELNDDEVLPSALEVEDRFMLELNRINAAFAETAQAGFRALARGGLSTDQVFLTCYVDYTASEYLVGSGPSTLTVAYNGMGEARSYALYKRALEAGEFGDEELLSEDEYEAGLDIVVEAVEGYMRGALEGREGVVFLAPMGAHNAVAVEAWQAVAQWDVQRVTTSDGAGGGASGGVSGQVSGQADSPVVTTVNVVRYGAGAWDPEHTQTLSRLKERISTAVGSSSGGSGGVSGQVDPPGGGVVSGQSDSSSGSGGSSSTATACPTPTAASSSASVTVTPTPTPTRVANVSGLRGYYESIGVYCFIGPYPAATATPTATTPSDGGPTQTESSSTTSATATPTAHPTFVPSQPPAVYAPKPGSLTATASGEDAANLTWGAVTGASGYSVQHREKSSGDSEVEPWRTASGSVTGTSYRVTGLWCGKEHEFRLGAYGDGTAYNGRAGLWSAVASATMGACTAQKPKFRSASYSFDVHTAMAVGGVVGKVSAYDVNGDAVTYLISDGNSAGKFGIGGSTGEITVAGSLASVVVGSTYTLTVGAADGVSGTTSVTVVVKVSAPTCRSGVAVVDPRSNYWLVRDCEVLLGVRDTLRGSGSLNWSAGTAIESWDGVSVGWTPERVTVLRLTRKGLTGRIPPDIGKLGGLLVLWTKENQLSGEIPRELGNLRNLTQMNLKSNRLSGEIPGELGNLRNLTVLILRRNQLSGEIPGELGNLTGLNILNLALNRLSGELPRELEGLTSLGKLLLFDKGDTGNKFTGCIPAGLRNIHSNAHVSGLSYCNSAPVFGSSEYIFAVGEDAGVGSAVGTVSASDIDEGNTLSYSIYSGNEGGAFSMSSGTGSITVGSALDYEAKRRYALTVVVNDGAGGRATTTASVMVTNVLDVCLGGVAVGSPRANTGLAGDCEVLLVAKDRLRGSGSLNWSVETAIGSWDGVTVGGTPRRVTGLALDSRSLTGSIPWELGSLSELTVLNLHENSLTGSIPPELGSLRKVTYLRLSRNSLTGVIPSELGGLSSVTYFNLAVNSLTGVIPSELGDLSNLRQLWLKENQLSGSLPSELGGLSKLTHLMLWVNRLSGEIPGELGGLSNLTHLAIHTNRFTGCNPAAWRSVAGRSLQVGLPYCNGAPVFGSSEYVFAVGEDASVGSAVGTVSASDVDAGDTLSYSIMSGNVGGVFKMAKSTGAITVGSALDYEATRRYALEVQVSDRRGGTATVVVSVGVTNVLDVCLGGVAVTSPSTTNTGLAGDCEVLLVAKDTLRGTGSLNWSTGTAIGSWDGVTVGGTPKRVTGLALDSRSLTGSIPWELGSLSELTVLNLHENSLTGSIPPELGSLSKVTYLRLSRNSLTGVIPSELGGLSSVTYFNLAVNSLTGVIPSELGDLSNLRKLWLKENQLSGSLPSELGGLSKLTHLMLWVNRLSGEIPGELGGLSNLTYLAIQGNMFTGCVPAAWRSVGRYVRILPSGLSYCHPAPGTLVVEFEDSRVRVSPPSVTGATRYEVELSGGGSTRTTSCVSPGGCSFAGRVGQSYTARARYTKTGTLSEWSAPLTFTYLGFLASDSVSASRSGSSVTVRWTPASGGVASQRVRLLYTTSGCNFGDRAWDGSSHPISDGTTSSHTFASLDMSTYICIFPLVYNYYSTGYTIDYGATILVGKMPTPSIVLSGSSAYVVPSELSGAARYEAELSGDGSTRTTTCTNTWGCAFTGRVGQSYTARVRYTDSAGVVSGWSASKTFTFRGAMSSGSVSATRSGSGVTVSWTPVATGVVSQRVVLTFTESGCSVSNRIWSDYSEDLSDGTTRTHTFANVDLSEYACVFPIVFNYFSSDKAVAAYQYGSGVRLASSDVVGGAGGVSGQADSPAFDLSRDLGFIRGLEPARRFEFEQDPYAFSIREDVGTSAVVGVVRAGASDGSADSYAIVAGNDGGKFAIGAASGEITAVAGLDYEAVSFYILAVEARDGRGGVAAVTVEVTVVDVPDSSVSGAGPRDLVADASSDSVMLSWVAPEDLTVTGYRVLRRRAQVEDAFVSLADVATSTPMYVDSGDVVAGAKYVYRVVAVYDDADGDDARVGVVIPLPGPRDLVADASSDSVTLNWVAPPSGATTGYRVLRRRAQVDDVFVSLADVATSTPMYLDSGDVVAGAKYVYRVVAVYDDADGDDARVGVVIPLPGPRDLVADASSDSVTLNWVAPEGPTVTGYRVLRRRAQVDDEFVTLADVAASTSMYVDTRDVSAGVKYVYRVVAMYADADGGDARVAVTTP